MKYLLLASTALVASTSFALADVDISGSAEMGVMGMNSGDDIDDSELEFHTDIDVTFTMAGETDAGLTFGAEIDLDESTDGDAFGADTQGGEVIFVSGAYGTLTMGDTDGALDFALQEAIIGSSIADDHEHAGYNGNAGLDGTYDGQVARYDYTFGDISFAVSAEIDDDGDVDDDEFFDSLDDIEDNTVLGIGMKYSGSFGGFDFGAGLGYQQAGDSNVTGISLDTDVAGFRVILNYSSYDDVPFAVGAVLADDDFDPLTPDVLVTNQTELDDHFGIAIGYSFGEILVSANYGVFNTDQGDVDGYGLVANYELGGGAALELGYGRSDYDEIGGEDDLDTYSFGISMDF